MKKLLPIAICSLLSVFLMQAQTPDLYINEFLASNQTGLTDASGEYADWVEIYNAENVAVDIGGMYVTDDLANPTQWQIPTTNPSATTIAAGDYLILFFDKDINEGVLHVDAKLGAAGESIGLYASDGSTQIDAYTFGIQSQDVSEGRDPDGSNNWAFYTEPTPGATNDTPTGTGVAAIPVANVEGGFYNNSVTVSLSSATPGATIYYRLDGSEPDDDDEEYDGPINFNSTEVLRAVAYASGMDPSKIMTHTYLIDVEHDNFVVVTMSTDPDNLFDPDDGLFPNYEEELEKIAHIQFFEPDGTLAFSQDVEIELHGKGSLSMPQKSLKMKAKSSLGNSHFDHKIFPDEEPDKYRSFVMRQSGQDWNKTMFRDALEQDLMGDVTDLNGIIEEPDLDLQSYRPGILYINGEYWGVQNVRAQMSWKYINAHYGLDEDQLDVTEDNDELKTGTLDEWEDFTEFLEDNSFFSDAKYQMLREKADIDHFIDYMLHGIIVDNNDWPGNNNRHWRERSPDGKWRWLTKDMDFGFGLRPINAGWGSGDYTTNTLAICLAENSSEYYNRPSATLMLRRLMQNDEAETNFINRAADLLNTVFDEDRVMDLIDEFEDLYIPEMQAHFDVWQSGWNGHSSKVDKLRVFAEDRFPEVRSHFVNEFSTVSGTSDVTIDANPEEGGVVKFNTLNISESFFPWEGIYFRGVEVPAVAKANRGYFFEDWSGSASGSNPEILVDINSSSENLTANFEQGSTATDPIVINEINYNSPDAPDPADWVELYNPNQSSVDISGWYFEDESGRYFGLPANTIMQPGEFLLLVENEAAFTAIFPDVTNIFGSFGNDIEGFGLSGKGELITLKNAAGILIDEVAYDDNAPWPVEPDGNGPTLQLLNPGLDNSLAQSWISFPATPGEVNGNGFLVQCTGSIDLVLAPGQTETIVNWSPPMATTTCAAGNIVSFSQFEGPPSGSSFPLGTTIVGYQGVDQCDNVSTCYFEVTISAFPATINLSCDNDISVSSEFGDDEIVSWNAPTASTNCSIGGITSIIQTAGLPNGSLFPIGTHNISYEVTDACGTVETCSFSVTIIDETATTVSIDCPQNLTVVLSAGQTSTTVTWPLPIASTDCGNGGGGQNPNCGTAINGFALVGTLNDHQYYLSQDKLTWEDAKANCENYGGYLVSITDPTENEFVVDNIIDKIYIGLSDADSEGNFEWESGEPFNYSAINTAPDVNTIDKDYAYVNPWNSQWKFFTETTSKYYMMELECAGGSSLQLAQIGGPSNGSALSEGTYNISYEAQDDCGDVRTCSFSVTVEPNPQSLFIDCPNDITVTEVVGAGGAIVSWPAATATSANCNGAINLTQTIGSPSGSFFPIGNYVIEYEAVDACSNVATCSFNLTVSPDTPSSDYCNSGGSSPWSERIVNVTFGSIINDSGKDGYGDFTDQSTVVLAGESYPISIQPAFSWTQYDEYFRVWIDFNQDFDFDDSDELVMSVFRPAGGSGTIVNPILDLINIPEGVFTGSTRMRISMHRDAYANPCELFVFGEVEDYSLTLIGGGPEYSGNWNETETEHQTVKLDELDIPDEMELRDVLDVTVSAKSFRVYPNPAKDYLTIDLGDYAAESTSVEIYNALGQLVFMQKVVDGLAEPLLLNITDYGRGLYLVTVLGEDGTRVTKQVVIH